MILLFTGNGKGKTTAALGQVLRAVGRGKRVLMVQFIKGPWESGEDVAMELLSEQVLKKSKIGSGGVVFKKMGLGFVGILGDELPREEHERAAKEALDYIRTEFDNFDMIVMDEVNVAVDLKLIRAEDVLSILENAPDEKIILLTGRSASGEFIDRADLVTEMGEVKHPFNDGKLAEKNIEF